MNVNVILVVVIILPILDANLRGLCGNLNVTSYLESSGCDWDGSVCCYPGEGEVGTINAYTQEHCPDLDLDTFCDPDSGGSWWNPIKIFLLSFAGVVFAMALYSEC